MQCPTCGYSPLPERAKFCLRCGTAVPENLPEIATEETVVAEVRVPDPDQRQPTDALVLITYGTLPGGKKIHLPPTLHHPTFGREEELEQLTIGLSERQMVLLYGPPGLGKTDLAAEVTQRLYNDRVFADGVIWVDKVGAAPIAAVCDVIATHMGNSQIPKLALEAKLEATRKLLDASDALLILDDLATSETANTFVKFCRPCDMALLATSREQYSGFDLSLQLGRLSQETAIMLFRERALPKDLAGEICDLLDNNPLALVYAAGSAVTRGLKASLADTKNKLKEKSPDDTKLNVRVSFTHSCATLTTEQRQFLTRLGTFFVDRIGIELLTDAAGITRTECERLVGELAAQELIECDGHYISFHPLVRAFGRENIGDRLTTAEDEILNAVFVYLERYKDATPENYDKLEAELGNLSGAARYAMNREMWSSALKLAEQLYDLLEARGYWAELSSMGRLGITAAEKSGNAQAQARLLHRTAKTLRGQGRYEEATARARESLEIGKELEDTASTADTLFLLGLLSQYQTDFANAFDYFQKAHDLCLKLNDQPGVASCFYQLGLIAHEQLDYAEAEKRYQEALEIRRKVFGENHFAVGQCLNALALLCESMGQYTTAEHHYQEALRIYQISPGENQQDFAGTLNNLANLYFAMGNYSESEKQYQEALQTRRDVLPKDHQDIAQSLNNLANLYYTIGKYSEAAPLAQRAMEIYRTALGEESPSFANSLNILANLYYSMGSYSAAEPLYRQALEIKRKAFGAEHPDVGQILNNIALLYGATGQYSEAEPLMVEARDIYRKSLGESHPYYAQVLNNLALIYEARGNYAEAKSPLEQALAIRRQALRADHPDLAQSLNNLGLLHESLEEYSEAASYLEEAIKVYRAAFGELHPYIARSMNNLALVYEAQEKLAEAEPLYRQASDIYLKLAGEDDQDYIHTLSSLAELLHTRSNIDEAAQIYNRLVTIYRRKSGSEQFVAQTLYNLGKLAIEKEDYVTAQNVFKESLKIKRELGDRTGVAAILDQLGQISHKTGNREAAVNYYNESLEISRELADQMGIARSTYQLGVIAQERESPEEAREYYLESLRISEELGVQANVARTLERLSQLAQKQSDFEQASVFGGRVKEIKERLDSREPLHEVLKDNFTAENLRVVVSDLGLIWESLPGESYNAKVSELISWTYREGKEKELQNILHRERPNLRF